MNQGTFVRGLTVVALFCSGTASAQPTLFELAFEGPPSFSGPAGINITQQYFATLRHSGGGNGAQAWMHSFTADGVNLQNPTFAGTAAAGADFASVSLTSCPAGIGIVAVVQLGAGVTLPPNSTQRILAFEASATIPSSCSTALVQHVEGCSGPFGPSRNVVIQDGAEVTPLLTPFQIQLSPDGPASCFGLGLNPNGWIQAPAWNLLLPLLQDAGCTAGGPENMERNWVAPHDLGLEDPMAGDVWNDIDFGGAAAAFGYLPNGIYSAPTWVTLETLSQLPGTSDLPDGDLVDLQGILDALNASTVPATPGALPFPDDQVLALATTYINNPTTETFEIEVCSSSDDSLQVWLNNKLVINASVCRPVAPGCSERQTALLPPGVSKIAVLCWDGRHAWSFRLGLRLGGAPLTDGGPVEFLGPGMPGVVGQELFCYSREAAVRSFHCPNTQVPVMLIPSGPPPPAPLQTVVECIEADDPTEIEITGVSSGGAVDLKFPPPPHPAGKFPERRVIGTDLGGGCLTTYEPQTQTYTSVSTTGGDIWDCGDVFEFAYLRLQGDFDMSIRFTSRLHSTGAGEWGKFGLMARYTEAPDSRYVMVQDHLPDLMDPARVAARRSHLQGCDGPDDMVEDPLPDGAPVSPHPQFLRLTRRGNAVQGWFSDDPSVEGNPFDDFRWYPGLQEDLGPAAPAVLLVGFANSEHNSAGVAEQTVKFRITGCQGSQVPPPPPSPSGRRITWNLSGAAVGSPLSYTLRYLGRGATRHAGSSLPGQAIGGIEKIAFDPAAAGPVGAFERAHDIGLPPTPGSTMFAAGTGTYTMSGSGSDIWDTGDQFHFAYKTLTGDFLMEARITSRSGPPVGSGGRWGKHGFMARWTCDAASKYSMLQTMLAEPGGIIDEPRHAFRVFDGEASPNNDSYTVSDGFFRNRQPAWMRLVRRGNTISTYLADDSLPVGGTPVKWCLVGSDTDPRMPATVLAGMALTSHAGAASATITFDRFRCLSRPNDCADFEPLAFETAASGTTGLGSTPYTPILVRARVPASAADAVAAGGSGLGVKNRNWIWQDLTARRDNLEGALQLLWNNENRNFSGARLRFSFLQLAQVYIAWDDRHVAGGQDNPAGVVSNGWFDFNNAPLTHNAQGWYRLSGPNSADGIRTNDAAQGGDDHFARGGVWRKEVAPGEVLEFLGTGFATTRSPYVVFVRCDRLAEKGALLAAIDLSQPGSAPGGVAVSAGGFAPRVVTPGRLRLIDEAFPGSSNVVWFPDQRLQASRGFLAEFDVFLESLLSAEDPEANPGAGMAFVVVQVEGDPRAPFPAGLDVASLRGDGGDDLGFGGGALRQRTECRPSLAIEFDNSSRGREGEPENEPRAGGSPDFDGGYHVGLDINGSVGSVQTNEDLGVPGAALPDIYSPAGVHAEVQYLRDGELSVWLTGNDGKVPRTQVLRARIEPFQGELMFGFSGGTRGTPPGGGGGGGEIGGGAGPFVPSGSSTGEVGDPEVSEGCSEIPDTVEVDGPTMAMFGEMMDLRAVVGGMDPSTTASYHWEVVSGGDVAQINGRDDEETVELGFVDCGDAVVRVEFGDGLCQEAAFAQHSITVTEPPRFTSTPATAGVVGQAYSYQAAADGTPPIGWTLVTFPAGMTIGAMTGLVSWTPPAAGPFNVTIQATNDFGFARQSYTVTVSAPPDITSTPVTSATAGQLYSYQADASGTEPITWSLVTMPAGMTIGSGTGLVTWTPPAAGPANVTIRAMNAVGSDTQSFTINVSAAPLPPDITSTPATTASVGLPYTYQAAASGATPITWSLITGPAGMAIGSSTGRVTWTPVAAGPASVTIRATNAVGSDSQSFTITVSDESGVGPFKRGDCNQDGFNTGQVTDGVFLLNFLFLGGADPVCLAACDFNGDGSVPGTATDAVYYFNFNFLGGADMPEPLRACARSTRPGDIALGCADPRGCQ